MILGLIVRHNSFYYLLYKLYIFGNRAVFKYSKTEQEFLILNADWLVVDDRVIFIGYRQGCDNSSQRVR